MSVIDGRVLELSEIEASSTSDLVRAALDWVGNIRVEPNTHSAASKQAVCDILLALKYRLSVP